MYRDSFFYIVQKEAFKKPPDASGGFLIKSLEH
jgi:hypothetical protein